MSKTIWIIVILVIIGSVGFVLSGERSSEEMMSPTEDAFPTEEMQTEEQMTSEETEISPEQMEKDI